ncbi:MAG: radical SAM protein [Candidatus Rickettsia vulgarisii]
MLHNTVEQLIKFLLNGIEELNISHVGIGFHGGEPLLYGINEFDNLCNTLISNLSSKVKLNFSVQTNGLLINEKWISIFKKYSIDLGISIDGPKEYNDKHRVDNLGNGSYDRLMKKIDLLHSCSMRFGILTVVNPDLGGKNIYKFITKELKVKSFNVLLPHLTHDESPTHTMEQYGKCLTDLFKIWTKEDNPLIKIRLFSSFMGIFLGRERLIWYRSY